MLGGVSIRTLKVFLFLLIFLLGSGTSYLVFAQADVSGALYQSLLTLTNSSGSTLDSEQVDFPLSGKALITSGNISSDGLNSQMQVGGADVGSMPASDRLTIEGAVFEITGAFTDYTTEAQSATANDVPIFTDPITGTQNFYFGCYTRCRIVAINLSAPSNGSYGLEWTYWNGSAFVPHSNVSDGTVNFTVTGFGSVSWNMPTNWAETSVDGITSFWTRVQVTSPVGSPPGPIADQVQFETGMWWTYLDSLADGLQRQYRLLMGGPAMKTRHQIFTGPGGVTALDDATAELDNTYLIHWSGVLNFETSGGVKCIVCKGISSGDPFRLYISDSAAREVTVEVSGNDSIDFVAVIPEAVTEHSLDISSDGTEFTFTVGGVSTQITGAVTVTDSSDDWSFVQNNSAVYTERIYIIADASSLAFESFDSQGEWDTGTHTGTEAKSGRYQDDLDPWGQPAYLSNYYPVTGTDDGEWAETTGGFNNTSSNPMRMGHNSATDGSINVFFRFPDVNIAQGATVEEAFLVFSTVTGQTGNGTDTVRLRFSAIDADNASAPGNFDAAENAIRTTAFVDWDPVPHFVSTSVGLFNQSPNLASIIQEIIDRPGWEPGNSIVIYVEDNGTTIAINTYRNAGPYESTFTSGILRVRDSSSPELAEDFVVGDNQNLTNGPSIPGWTSSSPLTHRIMITGSCHGRNAFEINGGAFGGYTAFVQQTVSDVNPSEVWSFGARYASLTNNDSDVQRRAEIHWLDSEGATISTDLTVLGGVSTSCQTYTRNGLTAPANTSQVRIRLLNNCTAGGQSCANGGSVITDFDAVIACIAPTVPTFGDPCNRVVNPSFETEYPETPIWGSPTINPTNVNVSDSSISWDSVTLGISSILVETSVDNQVTWQPVGNGESIVGIDPGDDLTGTTLHIRITMTPDGEHTPIVSSLFVVILDDVLDDSTVLFFELRDLPTGTLTDHSPFTNTGTMEFPVPLGQVGKTASAVSPVSGGAGGFPGFGNLPEGLEPTRPSLVGAPTQPGGFFSGCTNAASLPLYDIFNPSAQSLDWDACTLYEVSVLGLSMVVGIGTWIAGGHPILAMILAGAIMFGGVTATVLSGWILITYAIVGVMVVAIARNI